MKLKPVKKDQSIVSLKMLLRIIFNGLFVGGVVLLQHLTNFMNVPSREQGGVVFTVFILFQLFNAFNSRELGSKSIFSSVKSNKIMVITFFSVFILHFIIVNFLSELFFITSLSLLSWVKCIIISFTIVGISEIYKLLYRTFNFSSVFINKKNINKSLRSGAN
jgi:Ca2+-transporting ATPase